MLYLFIALAIILIILGIVTLGSLAFQMTGMEPKMSMFQALSAFTNAGFTTTASENIVRHRRRRNIATMLILLGYIGITGVIATIIRSFSADTTQWLGVFMRLALTILGLYAIYFIYRITPFGKKASRRFARYRTKQRSIEQVYSPIGDKDISVVTINEQVRGTGTALKELALPDNGLHLLLIERDGNIIPSPAGTEVLQCGDKLLCYGDTSDIKKVFWD